jgi:hypothetical protein
MKSEPEKPNELSQEPPTKSSLAGVDVDPGYGQQLSSYSEMKQVQSLLRLGNSPLKVEEE